MAKKIKIIVKLSIVAGKASPAPPIGPSLGQHGINLISFCKEYNNKTSDKVGTIIPVEVTIFEDKSFTFILKTPPTSFLLFQACKIKKGSDNAIEKKVGIIKKEEIIDIAKIKFNDLNTKDLNKAIKTITGTAKNLGLKIEL